MNVYCIVQRKNGSIEQVFDVTAATGDRAAVDAFRRKYFAQFGGEVGSGEKYTTGVELVTDVMEEES